MTLLTLLLSCIGTTERLDTALLRPDVDLTHHPEARAFVPVTDAVDIDEADDVVHVQLTAGHKLHEIEDWRVDWTWTVDGYAYNDLLPGPTIRAKHGDTLVVDLVNELDVPTTIHWHGLEVPWDMDGVTWMQDPIGPGESFTYTFPLKQVGTFWYHPHYDTAHQVDLGLYGALIVEDPDAPAVDWDGVAILDDWSEAQAGDATPWHVDGVSVHGAHAREGLWTVNGVVAPTLSMDGGQTMRLRLINASNTGYLDLDPGSGRWIAGDQGLLAAAEEGTRRLLTPGDRAELELPTNGVSTELVDHPYSHQGGPTLGTAEVVLTIEEDGATITPDWIDWGFEATEPTPDPGGFDVSYTFQGDPHTEAWMMNGETYPDVTVQAIPQDAPSVVEVRNVSATAHPFHLHGMTFEVLSVDGVAPTHRRIEDTMNVDLYETVRLLVNPPAQGDWMAHCHILPHGHGGMMQVLRVESPGSTD